MITVVSKRLTVKMKQEEVKHIFFKEINDYLMFTGSLYGQPDTATVYHNWLFVNGWSFKLV